jgi:Ca2+-transporting ATPase
MSHTPTAMPADAPDAHAMTAEQALAGLDATVEGLTEERARARLAEVGPNALDEKVPDPLWRKFLRSFKDRMIIVLLVAAVVSAVVAREWETPIAILVVVLANAILNVWQERQAEVNLAALDDDETATSRVVRDGRIRELPDDEIVPGDIVHVEAGEVVPADGRLIETAALEVQEAALTGESAPVGKDADLEVAPDATLGDRGNVLFRSTTVSRGRGVMVVTATGMRTEIGRIAEMIGSAGVEKTPLQRRIDQLATVLTLLALGVIAVVFVIGLVRGTELVDLILTSVSLAVATIPEGVTAVVAFTLAIGATRLARHGAILKRLSAVETLGSTTQICTDKTGTLTLNEMTARRLVVAALEFTIDGEGYATDGAVEAADEDADAPAELLRAAAEAMVLCSDATVRDGELVGDPTEGALIVLAHKLGVDPDAARRGRPRVAELPFDSSYKLMGTYHERDDGRVDVFVKGAPGVVFELAETVAGREGARIRLADAYDDLHERTVGYAEKGLRTLAVARATLDAVPGDTDPAALLDALPPLELLALIAIVDPPRPDARDAIDAARGAGIGVQVITGDHITTAAAIAEQLGVTGRAASGADIQDLDDAELTREVRDIGVLARVSPAHKIRVVEAFQRGGHIVAMTGDGVNDAPALKQADIGVAMGRTGTDVAKSAAAMVLRNDDFATIIRAVREGRGIYDNIVRFLTFQLTTSWGFLLVFLAAGIFGIAGGAPFTAIQILLVNLVMDGPPALSLAVERPADDIMTRRPRAVDEPLLTLARGLRIVFRAVVMAAGTLAVLLLHGDGGIAEPSDETLTLAFTTFVFFQVFNLLNVRAGAATIFSARLLRNRASWISLGVVVALQVALVYTPFLQAFFDTTALGLVDWAIAIAVASSVLWLDELRKLIARRMPGRRS